MEASTALTASRVLQDVPVLQVPPVSEAQMANSALSAMLAAQDPLDQVEAMVLMGLRAMLA